jgi:hypothetical protein
MAVILNGKQAAFVEAVVANDMLPEDQRVSGTKLALIAGVSEKNAQQYASKNLADPIIQAAIAERKQQLVNNNDYLRSLGVDAQRVLREWAEIATADPTEIATVRRLCCRHCYGIGFAYQYTDAEYARDTAQAIANEDDMSIFVGGPGFDKSREPNPECPECCGEGEPEVFIKDLRKLSATARKLVKSVRQGKYGIEVEMRDQEEALRNLARFLGVYVDRKELTGKDGGPIQTQNVNYNLPADPAEAARVYQQLMSGTAK